jgi:hypothetical protein
VLELLSDIAYTEFEVIILGNLIEMGSNRIVPLDMDLYVGGGCGAHLD